MSQSFKILKKGVWVYDKQQELPVYIIKQDWDFYYESGYDDDPPDLNHEGEAFYVIYGEISDPKSCNRSATCLSLKEALLLASSKINSKINWLD